MLHTILGIMFVGSRCGWIILPPVWNLDRLLDIVRFALTNLHQDSPLSLSMAFGHKAMCMF